MCTDDLEFINCGEVVSNRLLLTRRNCATHVYLDGRNTINWLEHGMITYTEIYNVRSHNFLTETVSLFFP